MVLRAPEGPDRQPHQDLHGAGASLHWLQRLERAMHFVVRPRGPDLCNEVTGSAVALNPGYICA